LRPHVSLPGERAAPLYLYLASWAIGAVLNAAVTTVLVRGQWRRHIILLAYLLVVQLTGVMDVSTWVLTTNYTAFSSRVYWTNDMVRNLFQLLLVFSLVWRYADSHSHALSRWMWPLSTVMVAATFYLHAGQKLGHYMSVVSRDFNFTATVLILVLWAVLVGTRSTDRTLLMITAGLGLACAGAAVGHSLRLLSKQLVETGNVVLVSAFLLGLVVWLQTFRRRAPAAPPRDGHLPLKRLPADSSPQR